MTAKIIHEKRLDIKPLVIGPRVIADVRRRVRELEARRPGAMTSTNRVEQAKSREFLASAGGGNVRAP